MNIMRAVLVIAVLAAACNGAQNSQQPAAKNVSGVLRTTIGGGYALIFAADDRSVEVASVGAPSDSASEDYRAHPLRLTLESGDLDLKASSIAPTIVAEGGSVELGWDLTGYRVVIADAAENSLAVPPTDRSPSKVGCDVASTDLKNAALVASVPDLVSQSVALSPDWLDQVSGRLQLTSGTLSVASLARGCIDYIDQMKQSRWRQKIASGKDGLTHETALSGGRATLAFYGNNDGTKKGQVVFRPNASGSVVLRLDPRVELEGGHSASDLQYHFEMFYRLVSPMVPKEARLIPKWSREGATVPVTPGEGCGGGRFKKP